MIRNFLASVPILGLGAIIILWFAWSANKIIDRLFRMFSESKIQISSFIAALLAVTVSCILLSITVMYMASELSIRMQR